jgi:hypothetical protein
VSVKPIVPMKPFSAVIVTVEVADAPAWRAPGDVAAIVKSVTSNVTVAECESVPLEPVIVTI